MAVSDGCLRGFGTPLGLAPLLRELWRRSLPRVSPIGYGRRARLWVRAQDVIDHIVIDLAKFSLIATLPTDQVASSLASSEKAQIAAWCLFKVGPPRPRMRRVKRGPFVG